MATLKILPFDPVRFACRACGRTVVYQKNALIDRYGDLTLSEIRLAVARECGCETAEDPAADAPPCGIVYTDLVANDGGACCAMIEKAKVV